MHFNLVNGPGSRIRSRCRTVRRRSRTHVITIYKPHSTMSATNVLCQSHVTKAARMHSTMQWARQTSHLPANESLIQHRASASSAAASCRGVSIEFVSCCAVMQSCTCVESVTVSAGRRQQAIFSHAQANAASTALEVPQDLQTPKEVAAVFQKLQNGSDIRGIAIAGRTYS